MRAKHSTWVLCAAHRVFNWIPAFAGMTSKNVGMYQGLHPYLRCHGAVPRPKKFTRSIRVPPFSLPASYTPLPKVRSLRGIGATPMDIIYLLFGFVLAAATLGFVLLCDRLGPR